MEPQAEVDENSKTPSNGGLSSSTRKRDPSGVVLGDSGEKIDVFVCVEACHGLRGCAFGTLDRGGHDDYWYVQDAG